MQQILWRDERREDAPSDGAIRHAQLSRLKRGHDLTSQKLFALIRAWYSSPHTAAAGESKQLMIEKADLAISVAGVLRRCGATPMCIERLAKHPPPSNCQQACKLFAKTAVACFQENGPACSNAYFPATAGHYHTGICWRLLDKHPNWTQAIGQHLESWYLDLAAGEGRWAVNGITQGAASMAQPYPGGRTPQDLIGYMLCEKASMLEIYICIYVYIYICIYIYIYIYIY
jgi:hypothetical protein